MGRPGASVWKKIRKVKLEKGARLLADWMNSKALCSQKRFRRARVCVCAFCFRSRIRTKFVAVNGWCTLKAIATTKRTKRPIESHVSTLHFCACLCGRAVCATEINSSVHRKWVCVSRCDGKRKCVIMAIGWSARRRNLHTFREERVLSCEHGCLHNREIMMINAPSWLIAVCDVRQTPFYASV